MRLISRAALNLNVGLGRHLVPGGSILKPSVRPGKRLVRVRRLLRDLHCGDVVVVFPQGSRNALLNMGSGCGLGNLCYDRHHQELL
jgi:hypothetical protein